MTVQFQHLCHNLPHCCFVRIVRNSALTIFDFLKKFLHCISIRCSPYTCTCMSTIQCQWFRNEMKTLLCYGVLRSRRKKQMEFFVPLNAQVFVFYYLLLLFSFFFFNQMTLSVKLILVQNNLQKASTCTNSFKKKKKTEREIHTVLLSQVLFAGSTVHTTLPQKESQNKYWKQNVSTTSACKFLGHQTMARQVARTGFSGDRFLKLLFYLFTFLM